MREPYQLLIIGTNKTGKTTLTERIVKARIKKSGRALIVTNHLGEWADTESIDITKREFIEFQGIRKTHMSADMFKYLINFHNGILVFDDAKRYVKQSIAEHLENLLISRGQNNIDIISVAHSFSRMPPGFFPYASHIVLFKTTESAKVRSDVLPDVAEILKVQEHVNKKAKTNRYYYKQIVL